VAKYLEKSDWYSLHGLQSRILLLNSVVVLNGMLKYKVCDGTS